MGLGGCIVLVAVGAILTFATDWKMESVNLDLVGVIMMLVGIIGIVVFTSILKRRRTMVPPPAGGVVEERYRHYE
jgi:predicted CDP-diglyceride synthetase/phosphatidate cytidylyltransferase